MSADDIKPMLTEQDIDDIILAGGHRNAAGGIYATSVYAFAKEIAVAAVEASRTAVAELPDSALTEAAAELLLCAEEIKAGHTIGGEWPDGEDDARIAHNRLHKLASALERMAAIDAIQADGASRAPSPQGDAPFLNDDDLADLRRLGDVFEDGEGWDIPKERMKRLAELGVVRWRGMDRYSITSFGAFLLKDGPAEFHALPLVTSEEFNAAQDAKLRQRLDAARSTPATEKGAEHG